VWGEGAALLTVTAISSQAMHQRKQHTFCHNCVYLLYYEHVAFVSKYSYKITCSQDSSVPIAKCQPAGVTYTAGGRDFSPLYSAQPGSGADSASHITVLPRLQKLKHIRNYFAMLNYAGYGYGLMEGSCSDRHETSSSIPEQKILIFQGATQQQKNEGRSRVSSTGITTGYAGRPGFDSWEEHSDELWSLNCLLLNCVFPGW
jgi:hypothetical protein